MQDEIIDRHGGEHGVLTRGAVRSALERARWGPFPCGDSLAARAAFILRGIAQDHPFADGNKRTALAVTLAFLEWNGASFAGRQDTLSEFVLEIAEGRYGYEGIVSCVETRLTKA